MTSQANWHKSKRSRNGLRLFRERLLILIHIWKLISWFHEHKNFCPRFLLFFSVAFFEHRGCFLELELILGSQSNNIIMWHWKCACTSLLLKLYETTGMLPIKSRFFYFRSKMKRDKTLVMANESAIKYPHKQRRRNQSQDPQKLFSYKEGTYTSKINFRIMWNSAVYFLIFFAWGNYKSTWVLV